MRKQNGSQFDTRGDRIFGVINTIFLVLIVLIMIYPIYFTVIASFSDPYSVVKGKVYFWPNGFTLEAYTNVFKDNRIWTGYINSIINTAFGTLLNLVLTIPTAYVLSKKNIPGRGILATFFLIPMYFGGGLIPNYLLVKSLGLLDTCFTLIILGGISIYNMIIARVYYERSIPGELYESARIDGADNISIFVRIALPLSAPIIAVMALYYAVGRWNEYFRALIYISSDKYQPLQMVLRNILLMNQESLAAIDSAVMDADEIEAAARLAYMAEGMKYALIFIASAPMLIAYPFVQKYFVKGVMIGSLKG